MQSIKVMSSCLVFLLVLISCGGSVVPSASSEKAAAGSGAENPKPQGWDVGGGGNAYAAEFKEIGRTVVRRLKGKSLTEIAGISLSLFEETLEKVEITTTEAVLKKGDLPVDALNYPNQLKIELSLVHWAVSLDFFEKRRLVIHEILGLLKKEDGNYQLTSEITAFLGSKEIHFKNFEFYGEVANTLIEKMPWNANEKVTTMSGQQTVTWYTIPFDAKWNKHEIKCLKVEGSNPPLKTDIKCSVNKYAYLSEDGVIHVSLADVDGDHPLWRLFDSIKERRFDYGVIKGDLDALLFKLKFFL